MNTMNTVLWDKRFLQLAKLISTWSKDPSTKVGAVIVGDKRQILSQGYNGFPRKITDDQERLNNRDIKYKYTIHAEANAIYNAVYNNVEINGSTIYVHGLCVCTECAKAIIQCGISRVVYDVSIYARKSWLESTRQALDMLEEAGVETFYLNISDEIIEFSESIKTN